MSRSPLQFDPAEIADLYAIGAATQEEAEHFERMVASGDPACRKEMERVRPVMEALFGAGASVRPSEGLRERVAQAISSVGGAEVTLNFASSADELERGIDASRMRLVRLHPGRGLDSTSLADVSAAAVVAGSLVTSTGEKILPGARVLSVEAMRSASAGSDGCTVLAVRAAASRRGGALGAISGWVTAAAAFVLAAVGWLRPVGPLEPVIGSAADARLIAQLPQTKVIPVQAQGSMAPLGAIGEFVWSNEKQRGYLRLKQFEKNNPALAQYQAWFFDGSRDHQYPVSAGVFDVSQASARDDNGDLLVLIQPDLPIRDLDAFAVTLEKSGGVVVTDKKGLVLFANAGG